MVDYPPGGGSIGPGGVDGPLLRQCALSVPLPADVTQAQGGAPEMEDRLQLQRFELKYIIREEVALEVREFARSYLEIDEYGASRPNLSYPVHSLYLDSDSL